MSNSQSPKWLTSNRKAHLIDLFNRSQGFCVFGHRPCPYPHHHYEFFIEGLIRDWIADDREQRRAEWQAERRELHRLMERREPVRGRFSGIAKDIYYTRQPQYYLLGLSVNGITFKPIAKVRLASSFIHLFVELGDSLKPLSKSKRRKAIRYSKALPKEVRENIDSHIREAVKDYINH